tara:strand:- start:2971 stop:4326 length:1356 start_codon:yes stop_codon:yes gene_type:complete
MAYLINQTSIGLRGSYDDLIYVFEDEDNTGQPKYRYACSVNIDSQPIAILRQLPNNADCAVFNPRIVAAQFAKPDENKWFLGQSASNLLSTNTSAFKTVTIIPGYQYAASANLEPTLTLLGPSYHQIVQLVSGNFTLPTSTIIETTDSASYVPDDANALFLSDAVLVGGVYQNYVVYDTGKISWAALAFINTSDSLATHIRIRYFNEATQLTSTEIENSVANGGAPPSGVSTDTERLLYLGVGTGNLEGYTGQSSPANPANGGWTHYDIALLDGTGGNAVSATYRFERLDCNKFEKAGEFYTLHWWNSKGGLDSLVFNAKSQLSQSIKRTDYRQIGGNSYDANGLGATAYNKYSYEGGKTQSNSITTTTFRLNTAFGNPETLSPLMMSLMNSERVYMTGSDDYGTNSTGSDKNKAVRVVVSDTSFQRKTSVSDGLTSYEVQVEISRLRPTR